MKYYEEDSQLRDILITGGDALMSQNKTIRDLLDAVYKMAVRKRKANLKRPDGENMQKCSAFVWEHDCWRIYPCV